jgi:hypothetical protein
MTIKKAYCVKNGVYQKNKKIVSVFCKMIFLVTFAPRLKKGTIAQLVEHRTENPGVPGSTPGGTTKASKKFFGAF